MGYRKYNNDSDVFIKPRIHDNGNWPAHRVAVFRGLHRGEHCEPTQELSVWEQLLLSMVTVKTPASGLQSRASSHWAAMLGWRIAETGMHTSLGTSLMFTICQQPDRPGMRTCQQ